jgi:hypothetical protein
MLLLGTAVLSAHLLGSACIFPPELEPGSFDAGPGSSPVILSAGPAPDFLFPGPMILDRQDDRTLSLTILDNDLTDVIHVRLYIDYGRPNPEPAYAECQAAPTGETTRVVACKLNSICNPIGDTIKAITFSRQWRRIVSSWLTVILLLRGRACSARCAIQPARPIPFAPGSCAATRPSSSRHPLTTLT